VGIDRPDDADPPSAEHSDHPAEQADTSASDGGQPGRAPAETRYREEYYEALQAAETKERAGPAENGQQAKPSATWAETVELSRWMWSEYKRRWPPEERPPIDRSDDPPGSWRGDGNRFLSRAANTELEEECGRIADRERELISPRLREVERCDPDRHLVGFKDRLKGRERIREKVADSIRLKHHSPRDAISLLPDTIRYTFQYDEARYTHGVLTDIVRMKEQGFKLDILKNSWSDDQYKGINSQWIEPDTGQRFEVQFHTRISFEAKQITHGAYERLRTHQADALEELLLEAFQKKVTTDVPIPSDATGIHDYPERKRNAR
jgi:hypothetical protein